MCRGEAAWWLTSYCERGCLEHGTGGFFLKKLTEEMVSVRGGKGSERVRREGVSSLGQARELVLCPGVERAGRGAELCWVESRPP